MSITKNQIWQYFIVTSRFLLAFTFMRYGYGKLIGTQFGIEEEKLLIPLKDIDLFSLFFYLFDHEPIKSFVGVSQILCGILLLINRTVIFGSLLFLPIVFNILIMDITFMPTHLALTFFARLSFYILLDFLILFFYKEKIIDLWNTIWKKENPILDLPFWSLLFIPLFAIGLEIIGVIPKLIIEFFYYL